MKKKLKTQLRLSKNKEADKKALKDEIDRLTARYKSIDNDITWLKTCLQKAFEITGYEKVKGLLFTVFLAKNQPSVVVDEEQLPKKYFVQKLTPDKATIKELLKSGKTIKGASLQESRSLRIK